MWSAREFCEEQREKKEAGTYVALMDRKLVTL